jgi:hypothetical protein
MSRPTSGGMGVARTLLAARRKPQDWRTVPLARRCPCVGLQNRNTLPRFPLRLSFVLQVCPNQIIRVAVLVGGANRHDFIRSYEVFVGSDIASRNSRRHHDGAHDAPACDECGMCFVVLQQH